MRNVLKTLGVISILAFTASTFAANSIEGKIGMGTIKGANDRGGFDAGLAYNFVLDRFFELSPELSFNWQNYDQGTGKFAQVGGLGGEVKRSINNYTLPLILNARIYPMKFGEEGAKPIFAPFVSVGAGYAWMISRIDEPAGFTGAVQTAATTASETYGGFVYNAMVGAVFALGDPEAGEGSAVDIVAEVGYRGGEVEKNNVKVDIGGLVARVGVRYGF